MKSENEFLPLPGVISACECHDRAANFLLEGQEFVGQFDGSIAVRVGEASSDQNQLTIPLNIIGYTTTSQIKGMGKTTLDFDFDRPIVPSTLTGSTNNGF